MSALRKTLLMFLLAASGGALLSACGASTQERTTGQFVDDGVLTARVKTALAREAGVSDALNVNVNTYRGVVQLSGFVQSEQMAQRAAEVARTVDGVQSVKNDLRVAP